MDIRAVEEATTFHLLSVIMTVTVKGVPAVWFITEPVFPEAEPGRYVSFGTRHSSCEAGEELIFIWRSCIAYI